MLQLAVAGRTMQNICKTYVPSVSFRGLTYVYRESALVRKSLRSMFSRHYKYRAKLQTKKYIFKIVKSSLQN